jgi:acyl-CoA thioesterase-1
MLASLKISKRILTIQRTVVGGLLMLAASASAYSAPKTVLEKIDAAIVNASISGETTSGGLTRLPALLAQHKPEMVVIELGANDGLRGLPVASAEANLRSMVTLAQKNRARVLLVGMRLPPNYGRAYTDKFSGMYKQVATELKAPLVPFMLEGVAQEPYMFQPDRLHPLATAHPIILANIWPTFSALIKQP